MRKRKHISAPMTEPAVGNAAGHAEVGRELTKQVEELPELNGLRGVTMERPFQGAKMRKNCWVLVGAMFVKGIFPAASEKFVRIGTHTTGGVRFEATLR